MESLNRFLDRQNDSFDFSEILSDEIEELDRAVPPDVLFKFYPKERTDFFAKPAFRFTQRAGLNDPFELTRRWREFGSQSTRRAFSEHIKKVFYELGQNKLLYLEIFKNEALRRGRFLSDDELAQAREHLNTKKGKQLLRSFTDGIAPQIDAFVDLAFTGIDKGTDRFLDELASKYGIFSVSGIGENQQLWALYASSGAGFVVELNTDHVFCKAQNGRHLVWQVKYTDEILDGLLSNPLYIFLVKDRRWEFEFEWRTLRKLSESDEIVGPNHDVHLMYARPGLIRAINFGYAYDAGRLPADVAAILSFDPYIKIRKAYVDFATRKIVLRDFTPI